MPERRMLQRLLGAALLHAETYEEVEANPSLTGQAALVVFLAAIAGAIGALGAGPLHALGQGVSAVIGWLVWAAITYLIGDKLLGGTASWGELLRTLGFAQAPGLLLVFAWIPVVGWVLHAIVGLWILTAGVIAVRQALDFSTAKALATVFLGWVLLLILRGIV